MVLLLLRWIFILAVQIEARGKKLLFIALRILFKMLVLPLASWESAGMAI